MPSEIVAELVESRYIVAELQERPSQGVQALIDKIYLYNPDAANKLIEELNRFIETLGNYGSYNSLTDKPVLNTTSTTSLAAVADEVIRDTIKLHKVSKTGSYSDLLSKPLFGSLAFKNTIYNSDVADGAGITKNKLSAAVQATLDKADASVGAIEAEAQARQEADEQLQANIEAEATARENEDIKLKAQIDANAAAIQKTREDYAAADEALQEQINSSAGDISTLRTDLDDLGEQVSVIESKIPESASETNQLVTSSQLTAESQDIRSEFAQADSELQQQINAHATAITGLEDGVEAIESKIPTTASQENLLATTSQLNDAIQDVRTDFAAADTDLQTQINGQAAAIGANQDDIQEINSKISSVATSENKLVSFSELEGVEQDIRDDVNSADSELQTQITAHATAISTLQNDLGDLGDQVVDNHNSLIEHISDKSNPHEVSKAQVGLGNVDNTSDMNKPVSTAMQEALDLKANQSTTYTKTESDANLTNALTDYVKFTDYANETTGGVIKTARTTFGAAVDGSGFLYASVKTKEQYDTATTNMFMAKGTLENIKYDIVKQGVTASTIELSDEEKAAARTWIGAGSQTDLGAVESDVSAIESKIPSTASPTNLLADRDFVNSSINNLAAFYLTSNAAGDAFATKEALVAGPYYFQGEIRSATLNDYAIVIADETKNNASTRYMYDGEQWDFQYIINDTPFTQDQVNAINSTVTQEKVESYSAHIANKSNPHNVTKSQVGLGNVDNTSDANKPISAAQQAALDAISDDLSEHIEDTNNPHAVTKTQIGLGNVDNTSDANKPISSATQAALNLKADASDVYSKSETYTQNEVDSLLSSKLNITTASTTYATISGLNNHINNKSNPHSVTKSQVGLGNVDNTSDISKPVSTAQQNAINTAKQDVIDQYMEADTALQTQITAHADELTSINEDIVDINEKIPAGASSTNTLVSTSQLEERAQSIISGYGEADSELQTQINGQASSITSLTGRVSTNESAIAMLDSDVDSLTTDVATAKSDISGLKTATNTQAGLIQDLQSGKQNTLTQAQLNAVNSGITSAKVSTYDNYATEIAGKQPAGDYATSTALSQGLNGKVDKNQGVASAGKVLAVNEQGVVEPTEIKAGGVNATYDVTNHRITFA